MPSKHYFAGHRNCPIWDSKQSLFNLCPGRDERTNMWIDKRTKWNNKKKKNPFDKFYNPYIKLTGESISKIGLGIHFSVSWLFTILQLTALSTTRDLINLKNL